MCSVDNQMDDFCDEEPLPQPETYPHPKSSPPLSPEHSTRRVSPCDEYVLISDQATAQNLPKGENFI